MRKMSRGSREFVESMENDFSSEQKKKLWCMKKGRKSDNRKAKRWDEKVKSVSFRPRKSSESVSEAGQSEESVEDDCKMIEKVQKLSERKKNERKMREKWKEIFFNENSGLEKLNEKQQP